MADEISEARYIDVAFRKLHHVTIDHDPFPGELDYHPSQKRVRIFVSDDGEEISILVSDAEAATAQAEIDAENEVTDEMVVAFYNAFFKIDISDMQQLRLNECDHYINQIIDGLKAALQARAKRGSDA